MRYVEGTEEPYTRENMEDSVFELLRDEDFGAVTSHRFNHHPLLIKGKDGFQGLFVVFTNISDCSAVN